MVKVELVYRKPVCMVMLPGGGLLPVDVEAVLLPATGDITPTEAAHYPQLSGMDREPTGTGGKPLGRCPRDRRGGDRRRPGRQVGADAIRLTSRPLGRPTRPPPRRTALPADRPNRSSRSSPAPARESPGDTPPARMPGELSAGKRSPGYNVFREQRHAGQPGGKPQELDVRDLPPAVWQRDVRIAVRRTPNPSPAWSIQDSRREA